MAENEPEVAGYVVADNLKFKNEFQTVKLWGVVLNSSRAAPCILTLNLWDESQLLLSEGGPAGWGWVSASSGEAQGVLLELESCWGLCLANSHEKRFSHIYEDLNQRGNNSIRPDVPL